MEPRCKKMINGHFRLPSTLSLGSEEVPAGAWLIYPDEDCCPECGEEIFRKKEEVIDYSTGRPKAEGGGGG